MNYRILFLLLTIGLFTWSCADEVVDPEPDDTTNEDLETAMQDAIIMENVVGQTNEDFQIMALTVGGSCPEVTKTTNSGAGFEEITWTLQFGNGCTTSNGVTRTGTAWIRDSMFLLDNGNPKVIQIRRGITYDGYSEDGVSMNGYQHEVYDGSVYDPFEIFGNGVIYRDSLFDFLITSNLSFQYPDGSTSSTISNATHSLDVNCWPMAPAPFEDIVRTKSGTTRGGNEYLTITMTNLLQATNCQYPVGGEIQISVNGNVAMFNYGLCECNVDQTKCGCDKKGQLTLPNGETKIVEIKKWW